MRTAKTAARAGVAFLVIASLAGCSRDDGGPAQGSGTTEAGGAGGAGATTTTAGGSRAGEPVTVDPDKVVATQTFKLQKRPENTVEVGVVSLKVNGRVAVLRLVFTPRFATASANEAISIYDIFERNGYYPYLLDMEHLKRYDVVRAEDGSSTFASDSVGTRTVNGTPMAAYAVFAAPEDGATKLDVHVADYWPAFEGIAVQR